MGRKLIQVVGSGLDEDPIIAPLLVGRYSNQFAIFLCDTEGDLPPTAWGRFAIVKQPVEGGGQGGGHGGGQGGGPKNYFYIGTDDGWKRAELEPIDD